MDTLYTIMRNDGTIWETRFTGEARFWAWLSIEFSGWNVFKQGGSGLPLTPFDIYL